MNQKTLKKIAKESYKKIVNTKKTKFYFEKPFKHFYIDNFFSESFANKLLDSFPSLNSNNWTHELGTGNWGWGNGELQYYQSDNSTVSNGKLTIEAREEPQGLNFLQAANFALLFCMQNLGRLS